MKYANLVIIAFILTAIMPCLIHAHGVQGTVENGGIVVTAQYDTAEAMSYAKVKISAPRAKLTFQSGRTDRNGRFCFFPDMAGEWKVEVDDEIGHRLDVDITVDETMRLKSDPAVGRSKSAFNKYEKALMGISVIFGLSGFLFWWKSLRSRRKFVETQSLIK